MMSAAASRVGAAGWLAACALAALLAVPLVGAWRLAPDLGHGWAAPLLMVYLWWERWRERPALAARRPGGIWWLAAVIVGTAALPLRLLLTPFPLWPALVWLYVGLLVAVALGAADLLAGRAGIRWLGGPLIILAAALPWGNQLEQHIVYPMRVGMASITAEVSNILGRPAIAAGTSVRLGHGWVGVDEACGGIRSLEASIMLALFFGEWLRFSWKRRAALIGVGVAAALLGNFLRILFLSMRAGEGAAAFLAAHDAAGWAALAFSLALIGLLARHWARSGPRPKPPRAAAVLAGPSGRALQGATGWLLFAVALLLFDEGATRGWYARGATALAAVPQWTAQLPTGSPSFRPAPPLNEEARDLLVPDRYIAGSWPVGGGLSASAYYLEWQKGQVARFVPFMHNPTVCLPLAGCELKRTLGDIPVRWAGGEIPFHAYIFRRAGEELAVAFAVWDPARGQPLAKPAGGSPGWFGWFGSRWADVREARKDQPAQLLSLAVSGPGAESRLASTLEPLIAPR